MLSSELRDRLAVLALLVMACLLAACTSEASLTAGTAGMVKVQRDTLVRRVEASGELRSANSITAGCPTIPRIWNFSITSMAPEGKPVDAGQPLVSFDPEKLRERLDVKESELDTARKELEKTRLEQQEKLEALILEQVELQAKQVRLRRQLDVPEELQKGIELAKLQLDAALVVDELKFASERIATQKENRTARIRAGENRVQELEREVRQIREYIDKMTVRAMRGGFVVYVANWRGEKPQVGESVWRGRSLLEVADLSQMEVAAEIDEPDAGYVAVGQQVEIRLDAAPERLFTGRIEQLGRLFRRKSWEIPSKVFDAVVSIDEPDKELMRPGMAATVEIIAPTPEPVVQIPEQAVRFTGDGPVVEARRNGGAIETVPVALGQRWQGQVVVVDGLAEGDEVRVEADES